MILNCVPPKMEEMLRPFEAWILRDSYLKIGVLISLNTFGIAITKTAT